MSLRRPARVDDGGMLADSREITPEFDRLSVLPVIFESMVMEELEEDMAAKNFRNLPSVLAGFFFPDLLESSSHDVPRTVPA